MVVARIGRPKKTPDHFVGVRNVQELTEKFEEITRYFSQDTAFMAHSSLFMAQQIVALRLDIAALLHAMDKRRGPRKATAYNRFASRHMKAGKTISEVAVLWAARKRKDSDG